MNGMNDNNNNRPFGNQQQPQKPKMPMPNSETLKGLGAIIAGVILVVWASFIIVPLMVCLLGFMLIYYGLGVLKMHKAKAYCDKICGKIKHIFGQGFH